MNHTRGKKMRIAVLNITSEPPFDPNRYLDLFNFIYEMDPAPIGIFGHERLTLYRCNIENGNVFGEFGRYTYIDPNSPWWDSDERKALLDSEGNPMPQVREGIGPNFKEITFYFFSKSHLLYFDLKNITPHQLLNGLTSIISNEEVLNNFGKVNITIMPKEDALDIVLRIPNLKNIKFSLTIPNPDTLNIYEKNFEERMARMGARTTEQKFTSQTDKNLEPDAELISMMELASKNGYVQSAGKDADGKKITRSTKQYPLIEKVVRYAGESKIKCLKRIGEFFTEEIKHL